ncbi:hypothetical protein DRO69_01735, partial [Candidatus Bathyarchaeota archaeon]
AGVAGAAGKDLLGQLFPPGVQAAKKPPPEPKIPINSAVIIGAGVAGLTAAMLLTDMGKEVTVLESCHRPGGRIQTATYPNGQHAVVGFMEWYDKCVDPDTWWLLSELGFTGNDYIKWPDSQYYYWRGEYHYQDGTWTQFINSLPFDDAEGAAGFFASEDEIGDIGPDVCTWPLDTGDYPDYDYTDFEDWMLHNPDGTPHWRPDVAELWDINLRSELGVNSYLSSAAFGILSATYWDLGRGFYILKGGNYGIIERLMQRIPSGAVHLNEPVSSVTNTATGVQVETHNGTYTADVAIVATQHSKVASIVPELPSDRVAILESMGAPKNFLALQQYSERFWETKYGMEGWGGYSDHGVHHTLRPGAYSIGNETSFQTGSTGILSTYINEPEASNLWRKPKGIHANTATADKITNHVLDDLETYWPEVRDYYIEGSGRVFQWDPYGPIWPVEHVLNGNYAKNKQPVGRIYFAGDYIEDFGVGDAILSARNVVDKFE